jgi:hypothetical protein
LPLLINQLSWSDLGARNEGSLHKGKLTPRSDWTRADIFVMD